MRKEMVAVVDEHDKVVAIKSRDELTKDNIVRVSVLWIEDGKGNVLLQQRALTKKIGPGQWGPAVAGTVEAHETYLSNVVKEAEEEIGLTDFEPVEVGRQLYWEPDGRFGRMFAFFKTTTSKKISDLSIKEDEVAQLKWISKRQLLAKLGENLEDFVPSAVFWKKMYY